MRLWPLPTSSDEAEPVLSAPLGMPGDACHCSLALSALHDMFGHGETEPTREVGGILLGAFTDDEGRECTWVEDIVPALLAMGSSTSLTFTHETWAQIHSEVDSRADGLRIVGWYHTHPGFGPFYSAHDLFIHRNFFADPRHVGLVLDPVRVSLNVFGWVEGDIAKFPGCLVHVPRDDRAELETFLRRTTYI